MHKSFIFTIAVAVLSSVVHCQIRTCDKPISDACSAFCLETPKVYKDVGCGLSDAPEICSGTLVVGNKGRDYRCKGEIKKACLTFRSVSPKALCICKEGAPVKCRVNITPYHKS